MKSVAVLGTPRGARRTRGQASKLFNYRHRPTVPKPGIIRARLE